MRTGYVGGAKGVPSPKKIRLVNETTERDGTVFGDPEAISTVWPLVSYQQAFSPARGLRRRGSARLVE